MTETDFAKAELKKLGIIRPSPALIENFLRAASASQAHEAETPSSVEASAEPYAASEPSEALRADHTSESALEPMLRERGQLQRQLGPRRPGRPRIIASWFPKVAETMSDGTSLETALAMNGITNLSKSEIRACYRNKTLQAMYQEARRKFLAEHYGRKPTLRAKIGRYL